MDRYWQSMLPSEAGRPGREQNLLVATSKHLYATRDGTLKHQQKAIEPRLPGTKTLLTRMVLLDVGSGVYYGELHDKDTAKDLAGFLARAWCEKPDHPMHGVPALLNVPRSVRDDADYAAVINFICRTIPLAMGSLPSGYSAGAHAAKGFEERIRWSIEHKATLDVAQRCSALASSVACHSQIFLSQSRWRDVPSAPSALLNAIDSLYDPPGGWRRGPWEDVLNGANPSA